LLPLLQQQCYVQRLGIGDGILSEARPQVFYYSIAYDIWPTFRDGYYRRNSDGTKTLLKDPSRQQIWGTIDRQCKFPPQEMLDTKYSKRK
jgi:hypothetical protein